MAEVKTKYDHMTSFGFSFCLYAVVSVAARIVPILIAHAAFAVRAYAERDRAEGGRLVSVQCDLSAVRPADARQLFCGDVLRLFASPRRRFRTARSADLRLPHCTTKLALVLAAGLVFDVYLMFSMELRSEFLVTSPRLSLRLPAWWIKTNLLAIVSERDLQLNYFTLEGLTPHILGIGVVVTLVLTAAAFLPAYYGRRQEVMGTSAYQADKSAFRQSLGIDPLRGRKRVLTNRAESAKIKRPNSFGA